MSPLLWRAIGSGLWSHADVVRGAYDAQDLMDVLEFLEVRDENQRRADEWAAARAQ